MISSTKILCAFLLVVVTSAFAPQQITLLSSRAATTTTTTTTTTTNAPLNMAPKWDGKSWVPTTEEEGTDAYGPLKTLLLHGPIPFYNRIFKKADYEQAVLKFMAGDKVSRLEAQGNMDYYLANPNDWAYNRFEMEKRGTKYDYTTLKTEQLTLTLVWSTIVVFLSANTIYAFSDPTHDFWDFLRAVL